MSTARQNMVLQASVQDRNLPASIRLDFVKKVYGILAAMLVVSFGLAAPFVFNRHSSLDFMRANIWILYTVSLILLLHHLVNLSMFFERSFGGSAIMRSYLNMFCRRPWNYMFVFTYSICFGVILGFIVCSYEAQSVCLVFLMAATLMAGLTIYAVKTNTDFTGMGMYIFVAFFGLFLMCIFAGFVFAITGRYEAYRTLIAGVGAIFMSFLIVYDTQLIFGTAAAQLGGSVCRKVEFTVDMYCFAAYQLYLDFINLFLYLLELFGQRLW